MAVKTHPTSGRPYVTLTSRSYNFRPSLDRKVHVVCGGGTGRGLIESLVEIGYQVSCGVVNVQDSDWETARRFDLEVVVEAPFAPISEEKYKSNLEEINQADTVVLTDIPLGRGNLYNIQAVKKAVELGKEVLVINKTGIEEKDYTAGEGREKFEELVNREEVTVVKSESEALEELAE